MYLSVSSILIFVDYLVDEVIDVSKKMRSTRVEPIRNLDVVSRIKRDLQGNSRNYCLFVVGMNTGLRASELLNLKISDVIGSRDDGTINVWQKKSSKYRRVTINDVCSNAMERYLQDRKGATLDELFFVGQRGGLTSSYLTRLIKRWCSKAGAPPLNYGSHTLRKTWGYHQRVTFNADIPTIMVAYGHVSQQQTLAYLGVQASEVASLYKNSL